jgi:hypothetical protein
LFTGSQLTSRVRGSQLIGVGKRFRESQLTVTGKGLPIDTGGCFVRQVWGSQVTEVGTLIR